MSGLGRRPVKTTGRCGRCRSPFGWRTVPCDGGGLSGRTSSSPHPRHLVLLPGSVRDFLGDSQDVQDRKVVEGEWQWRCQRALGLMVGGPCPPATVTSLGGPLVLGVPAR